MKPINAKDKQTLTRLLNTYGKASVLTEVGELTAHQAGEFLKDLSKKGQSRISKEAAGLNPAIASVIKRAEDGVAQVLPALKKLREGFEKSTNATKPAHAKPAPAKKSGKPSSK